MSKFLSKALLVFALLVTSAYAVDLTPNGSIVDNALGGVGYNKFSNSASSEIFADTMLTSVMVQREFRKALPSIHTYSQTAHMQNGGNPCAPGSRWVMWDTPFAMRENRKSKDGYLGYKTNVSGFATGISRMLGETTAIGLAIGYDYRKMDGRDDYYLKERGDAFHAALYGGTALGCFFFDGYAGYSRTWHRTERDIYGDTGVARTSANFNDTVLSAGLKASYVWILPNEYRITSSVGLDYSHVRQSHITDKMDGDFYNAIDKANHNFVQMPLIVSANRTFSAEFLKFGGFCSLWTPEIRVGYIPQFGSKRTDVQTNFDNFGAGRVNFQSKSTDIGRNHGLVGGGLKLKLRDRVILAVDYNYQFAKKYDNHTLTATYGVSF